MSTELQTFDRVPGGGHRGLCRRAMRYEALSDAGETTARCLIADDDEGFTYNKRVNRQEHLMLRRALERGVPEEKLAKALNVDIKLIKRRRVMLEGICAEVIDLLSDKLVSPLAFDALRTVKPARRWSAPS